MGLGVLGGISWCLGSSVDFGCLGCFRAVLGRFCSVLCFQGSSFSWHFGHSRFVFVVLLVCCLAFGCIIFVLWLSLFGFGAICALCIMLFVV